MIEFTGAAIEHLAAAVEPTDYVRVGVGKGGCAGLSYTIEVEETKKSEDVVITLGNVKICMDPYTSFILRETVVDYTKSLHQSGFKFLNSKATKSCACGTSFKPEEEPEDMGDPAPVCLTAGCGS